MQHTALVDTYAELGAQVQFIRSAEELPDMVFTANGGLIVDDMFVPSHFRYRSRSGEAPLFREHMKSLGFNILELPSDSGPFEGAGDALPLPGVGVILASGFRSSPNAAPILRELLGVPIVAIQLTNPYFYHLDTCFAPLPSGRFLYFPDAFDDTSQVLLRDMGGYWVSQEFSVNFGCNLVIVGRTVVTSHMDARIARILNGEGLDFRLLDTSEFKKSGGGVRCLSLTWGDTEELPGMLRTEEEAMTGHPYFNELQIDVWNRVAQERALRRRQPSDEPTPEPVTGTTPPVPHEAHSSILDEGLPPTDG